MIRSLVRSRISVRLAFTAAVALSALMTTVALIGCASADKNAEPGGGMAMLPDGSTQDPYLIVIEQFSAGESEYQGFYNQFTYRATLLNAPIREALLLREANYFKWSPEQLAQAKAAAEATMNATTEVFMSFYTPERRNDNLTESKSIWRIYLDIGTRRFQGVAKKARKEFAELQSLYPYHTRWNTPYVLSFEVPTGLIQSSDAKLTVTGPLGTREVVFPAVK